MVKALFAKASPMAVITISLLAGVGEEFLFRGVFQGAISRWWGQEIGWWVASLLFGLAHFVSIWYALLATISGLYLGWLWLHFDNLMVPVVAHGVYDFFALLYFLHLHQQGPEVSLTVENQKKGGPAH